MALRISIPMPARLTHYVLAAALESSCGSAYWLRDYSHRAQSKAGSGDQLYGDYCALHIGAPSESQGAAPIKHSRIGASRIARALELMLTCGNKVHAERVGRLLADNFDAEDADVVLQFAAFGEVVYG